MRWSVESGMTLPHGLFGELTMIEPRARADEPREVVRVRVVAQLLAQAHGHRRRSREPDHRLVDGEAGVRVDDLVALFREREDREEHDRLAAGRDDHAGRGQLVVEPLPHVRRDRLAHLGDAGRRHVVRVPRVERALRRLDDVGRRVVVRFTDAQEDDAVALCFERLRARQRLKRGLRPQS